MGNSWSNKKILHPSFSWSIYKGPEQNSQTVSSRRQMSQIDKTRNHLEGNSNVNGLQK